MYPQLPYPTVDYQGATIHLVPQDFSLDDIGKQIAKQRDKQLDERSFYLFDCNRIFDLHRRWKQELPMFSIYYAVKCNDDPVLLSILLSLGCGFDCASIGEIDQVLSLGCDPQNIIYAQPFKSKGQIRYASENGVLLTTFDSEGELDKIVEFMPEAKLILRIACNDATALFPDTRGKFGAEPTSEAPNLLRKAKELGLSVRGVSSFVGSSCRTPEIYQKGMKYANDLFEIGAALGHQMDIVDIGGGFPGFDSEKMTFEKLAAKVREGAAENFPGKAPKFVAEPGGFMSESAAILCFNIIAKVAVNNEQNNNQPNFYKYIASEGIWGAFNMANLDRRFELLFPEDDPKKKVLADLYGPTCDSGDVIVEKTLLPDVPVGTWLISRNKGGYTTTCTTKFNGFPMAETFYFITQENSRNEDNSVGASQILKTGHLRWPLILCIIISFTVAADGSDIAYQYSTGIMMALFTAEDAALFTVILIQVPSLLAAALGMALVDVIGRRKLILTGLAACVIGSTLLSICKLIAARVAQLFSLLGLSLILVGDSLGPSIVRTFVAGELCPLAIRSLTLGVMFVFEDVGSAISSLYYPPVSEHIGSLAMLPYAILSVASFLFLFCFLPETKHKSVDEVVKPWVEMTVVGSDTVD